MSFKTLCWKDFCWHTSFDRFLLRKQSKHIKGYFGLHVLPSELSVDSAKLGVTTHHPTIQSRLWRPRAAFSLVYWNIDHLGIEKCWLLWNVIADHQTMVKQWPDDNTIQFWPGVIIKSNDDQVIGYVEMLTALASVINLTAVSLERFSFQHLGNYMKNCVQ